MLSFLLIACQSEFSSPAYTKAELIPPFEHGNSGWAGVSLLDFDGDGWVDIFFSNGLSQADALYQNQGNGQFIDRAATVGLNSTDQHGGVASADLDNDGDPDLVIIRDCSLGTLQDDGTALRDGGVKVAWNNQGVFETETLLFTGQALEVGICPVSVELVDTNGDGWLDISISNGLDLDQVYPWIYRKETREGVDLILLSDQEGGFEQSVILESVPIGDVLNPDEDEFQFATFTSAYMDVNFDGLIDKISGYGGGPLGVYIQEEENFFQLRPEWGTQVQGLWMGLALADFDGDGDIDIYSTNQGLSPLINGFDNIPEPLPGEEWTEDWLARNVHPFHTIFENQRDFFKEQSVSVQADHLLTGDVFDGMPQEDTYKYPDWMNPEGLNRYGWAWAATPIDIDADGWMDVVFNANNCAAPMNIVGDEALGAGPGTVLRNQEGNGFEDVTWKWGLANVMDDGLYPDGRGLAVGDLNNDGYPDIVYANRTFNPSQSSPLAQQPGQPSVLLSKGRPGNWLQIDLVGVDSNRDGIGSYIRITTDERSQFYLFEPGGTTNSSNERLFMVGVGDAKRVDIAVLFPSGKQIRVKNVQSNQRIKVEERES
jgi:enediyne biosynthesis protein E4